MTVTVDPEDGAPDPHGDSVKDSLRDDVTRWRVIADHMPQKIFTATPGGEVDYFNPQWSEFTGLAFEVIRDWGWTQFIHPDDVAENVRRWRYSIESGEPFEFEHRFRRADGAYVWHLSRARAVRDAHGGVTMWIGSNTDVDTQKHAEKEAAHRARLAMLSGDIGAALTVAGSVQEVLQRCTEAIVRHLDAAFARIWTIEGNVLELQASAGLYTHRDGVHSRVPVGEFKIGRIAASRQPHLSNQVIGDPEVPEQAWAMREGMVAFAGYPLVVANRVVGVLALFARDTLSDDSFQALMSVADLVAVGIERQRAEAQRDRARAETEEEQSRLHRLIMEAPALICIFTGPEHRFQLLNPRYLELIAGRSVLGKPIREALPEVAGQGIFELLDAVYESGESYRGSEVSVMLERGRGVPEQHYFTFTYQALHSLEGQVEGILVFGIDVTDQVVARRQVESLAAEREATLGQIVDGVVVSDVSGRITFINAAGERLLGVATEDVPFEQHSSAFGVLAPDRTRIPADALPLARAVLNREIVEGLDLCIRRPDGTEITIQTNAAPIILASGSLAGGVATFRDVTAARELEQQKVDFLSAAAHDLKNPVAVVQAQAQLLKRRTERGSASTEQVLSALGLIEDKARVMTSLIDELIDVTRVRMGQHVQLSFAQADLADVVREVVAREQESDDNHRLMFQSSDVLVPGIWDVARLRRVFQNLLENARKYSAAGSNVHISVTKEEIAQTPWAVVAIRDSGRGIPEQDLPRIFDWFYRGSNVSDSIAGTGIGLAGARQFVEQHGGTLAVESIEGTGSTFTVRLPLEFHSPDSEPGSAGNG